MTGRPGGRSVSCRRARCTRWYLPGIVTLHLVCASWIFGGFLWPADLLGALSAQAGWVALAVAGVLFWRRMRRPALLAALAACIAWGGIDPARARHGRIPDIERVRVLIFNGHSGALSDSAGAFGMLADASCDVLILVEPSTELVQRLRTDPVFASWSMFVPEQARAGWRVVATRWPQRGGEGWEGGAREALRQGVHMMIVDRPAGAFGLVQFHPSSPRTPARWRDGNRTARRVGAEIRSRLLPLGIPVLAGGDLNATPSSWRSRFFGAMTGMRRAKPVWLVDGSWPAWAPASVRLAIDDLFVTPDVRVGRWRSLGSHGSDHRAVLIELGVPTS